MSKAEQEAERIIEMFRDADYQDLSYAGLLSISIIHVEGIIKLCDKRFSNPNPYFWNEVLTLLKNK